MIRVSVTVPVAEVADKILAFATGGTAGCSSGRSMARLYLALDGDAVPLSTTDIALDETRQDWWRAAMDAYSRGEWKGTSDGADRVRARHPEIAAQATAALATWHRIEADANAAWRAAHPVEDD